MQTKQLTVTLIGLAVLLLFALAVISFVPRVQLIHAQSPSSQDDPEPRVGFDTLDDWVPAGEYMNAGLLFRDFPCVDQNSDEQCDNNDKFTTVTYRFDIRSGGADGPDADNCEGQGLGFVRNYSPGFYSSWRTLSPIPLRVDRNCPVGDYTLKCMVTYTEPGSDEAIPLMCNMGFSVRAALSVDPPPTDTPTPTHTPDRNADAN